MRKILHSRVSAALLLDVSLRHVDYLVKSGALKSVVIGKRRLILHSELERLAKVGTRLTLHRGGRHGK
jgi:hypothetical protein